MYIYHALIKALSTHMIHINLNMIFYTHVEHSPTRTVYIKYYMEKQTHTLQTHTHTCRHFPGKTWWIQENVKRGWPGRNSGLIYVSLMKGGVGSQSLQNTIFESKRQLKKIQTEVSANQLLTWKGTGFVCRPQLSNWKGNWVCLQTTAFELKGELGLSADHSFWTERGLGLSAVHSFWTERGTGFVCRPQLLNWKGTGFVCRPQLLN